MESVTSHDLYPPLPLSQTVALSQTPSPLWSVTYFMDGPNGFSAMDVILSMANYKFMTSEFVKSESYILTDRNEHAIDPMAQDKEPSARSELAVLQPNFSIY